MRQVPPLESWKPAKGSQCRPTPTPLRFAGLLVTLTVAVAAPSAQARQVLYVANGGNNTVSEYSAVSGAIINANFIIATQGLNSPNGLAMDGNNHLFVCNAGSVGEYNATTGATINANFVTGIDGARAPTLDANNHLFVAAGNLTAVGEYDATTGAPINATFTNGGLQINHPQGVGLDGNNHLFVAYIGGTVGEYNATTGATIDANFFANNSQVAALILDGSSHIFVTNSALNSVGEYDANFGTTVNATFISNGQGLNDPQGMTLDGNHMFVANYGGTVGEYDATNGAIINANFITDRSNPSAVLFAASVPEPSAFALTGLAGVMFGWRRLAGRQRSGSDSAKD